MGAVEQVKALVKHDPADQSLGAGPNVDSIGSRTPILEEETQKLERDREDELETTTVVSADREGVASNAATRESTEHSARLERGSGTANVEEKRTGTERRTAVEVNAAPASAQNQQRTNADELNAARDIASNALGQSTRTVEALVDAGTYRGLVLGETERYLIQRQPAGMAVLHQKDLLDRQPQIGEVFSINCSNGRGVVREFRERATSNELSR
jgi:hypothetical protein